MYLCVSVAFNLLVFQRSICWFNKVKKKTWHVTFDCTPIINIFLPIKKEVGRHKVQIYRLHFRITQVLFEFIGKTQLRRKCLVLMSKSEGQTT